VRLGVGPGLVAPLFPATQYQQDASNQFQAMGLSRTGWQSAGPIRGIFRKAFTDAGLPYFNPRRLRKTLARFGQELCNTPEEYKAWSQKLGREGVLTTFFSYGTVSTGRQNEIMYKLATLGHADRSDFATGLQEMKALLGKMTP